MDHKIQYNINNESSSLLERRRKYNHIIVTHGAYLGSLRNFSHGPASLVELRQVAIACCHMILLQPLVRAIQPSIDFSNEQKLGYWTSFHSNVSNRELY